MRDNILLMTETSLITGSTFFCITNLSSVFGIVIIILDIVLIGFKIYQAIKSSREKGTPIDIEEQLNQAKYILQDIQDNLPKDTDNGGKHIE